MSMNLRVLIVLIALSLVGCATTPENGEIIFVKVTHIFEEQEYLDAVHKKGVFQGFFLEKKLSMLEAAINEGVTLDNVKAKRLVACECSCGAECYASYPLLLPDGASISLDDLVELEAGASKWQGDTERYSYKLGRFLRRVDIPFNKWTRMEGNHSSLPACYPSKWEKSIKSGQM